MFPGVYPWSWSILSIEALNSLAPEPSRWCVICTPDRAHCPDCCSQSCGRRLFLRMPRGAGLYGKCYIFLRRPYYIIHMCISNTNKNMSRKKGREKKFEISFINRSHTISPSLRDRAPFPFFTIWNLVFVLV